MLDIARAELLQRIEGGGVIIPTGVDRRCWLCSGSVKDGDRALFSGGLEANYFFSHMNSQMGSPLGMALVRTHLYCGLMASAMPSHMGWKA